MVYAHSKIYLEVSTAESLKVYCPAQPSFAAEIAQEDTFEKQLSAAAKLVERENLEVHILFQSFCFSLVPELLFEAANAPLYLNFLHSDLENSFISYESLPFAAIEMVYAVPKQLAQKIQKSFEKASWQNKNTDLLHWIAKESKQTSELSFWLHCEEKEIQIALFNAGRLLFFNSFETATWQDQLYYCMAITKQQNINTAACKLFKLGEMLPAQLNEALDSQFKNTEAYLSLSDKSKANISIHLEASYLCELFQEA